MDCNTTRIREIEKILDKHHKNSEFFETNQNNRNQALFDVVRVYESGIVSVLLDGFSEEVFGVKNSDLVVLQNAHNLQDSLNIAIRWIYSDFCLGNDRVSLEINDDCILRTISFLTQYADAYSLIVDGYTSFSQGITTGDIKGNNIVFESTAESITGFLADVGEQILENHEFLKEELTSMMMSYDFQNGAEQLRKSIHYEDGRLCYVIPSVLYDKCLEMGEKHWAATASIPQRWAFDEFTLEEFKKCWIVLYSICSAHFIAILKGKDIITNIEDIVIIQKKDEIIKAINQKSNVEEEQVKKIIETLIYNSTLRNTDIMYQPILNLGGDLIIVPSLIMTSIPERNLICVLQAIKDKLYFRNVNELERVMALELKKALPKDTVTCNGKNIGVTDIDFGIFDELTNSILLAEMKWLVAADSTKEVSSRQKEIDHGCRQMEAAMGIALADPIGFANRLFDIELV